MRPALIKNDERGVALVATLLAMLLVLGLMAGAFAAINADQRSNAIDRDQSQAYAAAHAGLEKLTSDLASLFITNVAPTVAQINVLKTYPPTLTGFEYRAPGGGAGSGYEISWVPDDTPGNIGNPKTLSDKNITSGPYAGFKGLITPYTITVTARSSGGAEVRLRRELNTVAVPVFQFGVFSEGDLTFLAGDDFDFGGRVHTNGHLYMSEAAGKTLKFKDKITAWGDVARKHFPNGELTSSLSFTGNVDIVTAPGTPGTYRNMADTEASVTSMPITPITTLPPANAKTGTPNWDTISKGSSYFKGYIRNRFTGARQLSLPLVNAGAQPIDLIRRAVANEDVNQPLIYGQRFYSQASVRIMLSDRQVDITGLPGVSAGAPVLLEGTPAGYVVNANRPPLARSIGRMTAAVTGVGGASPNMTITIGAGIPANFLLNNAANPVVIDRGGGLFHNMTCTGKTATTFTGCTAFPALITAGRPVTMTMPNGSQASTVTVGATNVAGGTTLTVASTATFMPISFFSYLPGNNASLQFPALVSCTGFTAANVFTGCAWWQTGQATGTGPANGHTISTGSILDVDTPLLGGFLKVERQNDLGVWTDVTMEILNLGIGAPNQDGFVCADPTPDAVLRFQRLADNGYRTTDSCPTPNSTNPYQWWPNALYDAREGNQRWVNATNPAVQGGVMGFVSLDVGNLKRWLAGNIGATGTQALNRNGYIVYFSDRRGNHNTTVGTPETGEYGFEDVVNPTTAAGTPDNVLSAGEDVNANGVVDLYGRLPWNPGAGLPGNPSAFVAGALAANPINGSPFTLAATPTTIVSAAQARVNRLAHFRRALKLVNGGINGNPQVNNLPASGLTVATENPVYIQGNFNATTALDTAFDTEPNVAAAVLADAVTLLSTGWTDAKSFRSPNDRDGRDALTTAYRVAVVAGKNLNFPRPVAGAGGGGTHMQLFGTDGGVGNFLRLAENWNVPGVLIKYRGSIISLYYARQATGIFEYGPNVYDYGTRKFSFDDDFLEPALLPPGTPMFRDVNTLNFRQMLRPTQ